MFPIVKCQGDLTPTYIWDIFLLLSSSVSYDLFNIIIVSDMCQSARPLSPGKVKNCPVWSIPVINDSLFLCEKKPPRIYTPKLSP